MYAFQGVPQYLADVRGGGRADLIERKSAVPFRRIRNNNRGIKYWRRTNESAPRKAPSRSNYSNGSLYEA